MSEDFTRRGGQDRSGVAGFYLWPLVALASASETVAAQAGAFARGMLGAQDGPERSAPLDWVTPNRLSLELPTMDLREFSGQSDGTAALICAPFALHSATIADFAHDHSIVEALVRSGCSRVFVTDWRSAARDMRLLTLDNYLAELNVAVDQIGPPVDLVGLCQGGVMALIFAARFPAKVRRLVLAGAPVDPSAGASLLSAATQHLPIGVFDEIVRLGEGRVLGQRVLDFWAPALHGQQGAVALQLQEGDPGAQAALLDRFKVWFDWTVDLPGTYYQQVVTWLFKENRLAEGRLTALGRLVDLAEVRHPLFLLAGRDDELVAPDQLLATRRLVGTPVQRIDSEIVPCGHLGLFVGRETLRGPWSRVGRWLAQPSST